MAIRPIYKVLDFGKSNKFLDEILIDFLWYPGFAKSQKQKSIQALHEKIKEEYGEINILEISSKSLCPLGVSLSAFNLEITHKNTGQSYSVESAFQSSKVFEKGGPYVDLRSKKSIEAKRDKRLKESGKLLYFKFYNSIWELEPKTAFYDWLYINALNQNLELAQEILKFDIFTDIEFNQNRSINCQARSAALYVSLSKANLLEKALESIESYRKIISEGGSKSNNSISYNQLNMFDL